MNVYVVMQSTKLRLPIVYVISVHVLWATFERLEDYSASIAHIFEHQINEKRIDEM